MKNQVYIQSKKEKTVNEIIAIKREFKNKQVPALYQGMITKKTALHTKFYQLSIIKKINDKPQTVLKKWLVLSRKKLCPNCKKGLKHGDLRCAKCFRVFILADMLRKSIR